MHNYNPVSPRISGVLPRIRKCRRAFKYLSQEPEQVLGLTKIPVPIQNFKTNNKIFFTDVIWTILEVDGFSLAEAQIRRDTQQSILC